MPGCPFKRILGGPYTLQRVVKLETDIGETGRRLIEVSPLTVGLFTLLTSILLAGLAELLRTAEVIHPWSVHSSDLHPLGWPRRATQDCRGNSPLVCSLF
jgi:hypothetical protein